MTRRIILSSLVVGVAALFGLPGCGEEAKVKETVSSPTGSTTTEKTVTSSGSNPPPNSAGETAKTANP
jgi:ABC-type glycerol-3-phosphate transport system substrate-binding protein